MPLYRSFYPYSALALSHICSSSQLTIPCPYTSPAAFHAICVLPIVGEGRYYTRYVIILRRRWVVAGGLETRQPLSRVVWRGRRSDSLSFRSFAALYHAQTTNSHNIRNLRLCARLRALHQHCSLLSAKGFVVIPSSSCHIAINIILVVPSSSWTGG